MQKIKIIMNIQKQQSFELPPLKDVIKELGLSAKKSLGQNFLFDMNLTCKIARAGIKAHILDKQKPLPVLEIGGGPGGLTRALLIEGVEKLFVIEKDHRCIEALEQISRAYPNKMQIIEGDALKIDFKDLIHEPFRVVANLPYYISSEILIHFLSQNFPPLWQSLTLLFQKEFADRLAAKPNSKEYGRLSVLAQWRCLIEKQFDISPAAFTPPPKIKSTLVKLTPKTDILPCDIKILETVTAAAFGQRRKMLRSSLKSLFNDKIILLEQNGIDLNLRADHLKVEDYIKIANLLASLNV